MFAIKTEWDRLWQHVAPHDSKKIKQRIAKHCAGDSSCLGADTFGLDPQTFAASLHLFWLLYRNYFRVQVEGWQHVPSGPMIVAGNHSGQLPFDAMMITTGFFMEAPQPVLLRGMLDRRVSRLPLIFNLLTRIGHMTGTREVCGRLLRCGQSVLVFPEGVAGICKPFAQRYRLQRFGHGFVRLAMQAGCPVLPIALIGAEEQAIAVANIKPLAKLFRLPYWPLVLPQLVVPVPLPVRYTLYIGKPLDFGPRNPSPSDKVVAQGVARVKRSIRALIARGLRNRQTVF